MMTEKLLPAIVERWPEPKRNQPIIIQQDNTRPHISAEDKAWSEAVAATGLDIGLTNQSPNSPDINVLDLGLLTSIKSRQYKKHPVDINELITAVAESYSELPSRIINNVFLTLQVCMENTILKDGGNDYKITHLNKRKLERENRLPVSIIATRETLAKIESRNV